MDHLLPSDYLSVVRRNIFLCAPDETSLNRSFLKVAFPRIGYFAHRRSSLPLRVRKDHRVGIETFISHLASECDGAKAKDGRGFDQSDKTIGHKVAAKVSDQFKIHLTESDAAWSLSASIKYQNQLAKKFGSLTVSDVISNQKFLYETVDNNCANYVLHSTLDEKNGVITFDLPQDAPVSLQDPLFKEVWALLRSLDIETEPPLNTMAKKLRKDWTKHCRGLSVPITCPQADLLIDALSELGFVIDQRLMRINSRSQERELHITPSPTPARVAPQLSFSF
jgi:hypothetical protein